MTTKPIRHIGELDLLRFTAAMAVLFYHFAFRGAAADDLSPLLYVPLADVAKYGYLGVDLFFMISGFVIMLSAQSGVVSSFVIARLARLYPALWVCCTLTFVAVLLAGETRFPSTLQGWAANMTMFPGWFGAKFLDGSYWTLGVEMKFYFLVACVIALGQIRNAERFMFGWLAIAIAHALVPVPWLEAKLILKFAPCFIAGALFYFIRQQGASPLRWAGIGACWILVLIRGVEGWQEQVAHYGAQFSVVLTCFVLTGFFVLFAAIALERSGVLGTMKWPLLGALTYPLYLIHQTIGYLLLTALYPYVNEHVLFWGVVALSLAAAYVIAMHFERHAMPVMRKGLTWGWRKVAPRAVAG